LLRQRLIFFLTDSCGRENGTKLANCASDFMAALAKQHTSPLAVRSNPMSPHYADCMAGKEASPAALASNLAYLQIDLTDPDFRTHLVKQARATRVALRWLVQAVVQAGELARNVQPALLTRTIEATKSGSMLTCAFYQQATAARWIRADLNAVLAPYARKPRR
jgi:hypothetical protein